MITISVKIYEAGLSDFEERKVFSREGGMDPFYIPRWSMSKSDSGGRIFADSAKFSVFY